MWHELCDSEKSYILNMMRNCIVVESFVKKSGTPCFKYVVKRLKKSNLTKFIDDPQSSLGKVAINRLLPLFVFCLSSSHHEKEKGMHIWIAHQKKLSTCVLHCKRSAFETAIEYALLSFYKSQRIKLLDVIATCNQLNVNAII